MMVKNAPLSEVCTLIMGQSPSSDSCNKDSEGLPFFQGNADFGENNPIPKTWCTNPKKKAEAGDILLSVRAPIGAVNIASEECCIGRGLAAIRPKADSIRKNYLKHLLMARRSYLEHLGTGSTFKAIGKKALSDFPIPVYPVSEQEQIERQFESILKNLAVQNSILEKLDDLVKSRFIEMFGTLEENSKSFEVKTLQEVCEKIKDGTHQTPTYTDDSENGFLFLSSKNVTSKKIDWDHAKYIPSGLHEELYAKIQPRLGDVLLAKNGTTGVAAIVDRELVFDIYVSLALLRPVSMNSVYLWAAVNSDDLKRQFNARLKGIGVPNLHLKEIREARLLVPPLELQHEFASFVQQVDKLEFDELSADQETRTFVSIKNICSYKIAYRMFD